MKIARTRREFGGFIGASLVALVGAVHLPLLALSGELQELNSVAAVCFYGTSMLAGFATGCLASRFARSRDAFGVSAVGAVAIGLAGAAVGGVIGAAIGVVASLALGGFGAIVVAICNRVFPRADKGRYDLSVMAEGSGSAATLRDRERTPPS